MRGAMRPVVIGLATVTFFATTAAGAYAASAPAATAACTAINAPPGMALLPASDDCPTPGARTTLVKAAAVPPTTPISETALTYDHTNGDLLAITKVDGTNDLAIGGNFSLLYTEDGVSHTAINFAVIDEATGTFLYGGSAGGSTDKYVRSIGSLNGNIYVGGDFTSWAGVSRLHAVMLAPTGNPASAYAVTSWNPAPSIRVRGLAVDSSAVYLGIESSIRAVNPTTGATIWSKGVSSGSVASVFKYQGFLFVGGLFNSYNGVAHPGLVKVNPSDGSLVTAFDAHLRPNTGQGQYGAYDGEEIITMAPGPNAGEILAGSGGHAPVGDSSNEALLLDVNTGARLMHYSTLGDCQGIGTVGDTTVAGYHNNTASASNPLSANYFGIQLENSGGANSLGVPTTWDPRVNGNQGNADGGNNGIQAMYVDQGTQTIYLGGAFLHWNGTTGSNHQSLIAFSFAPSNPTAPGSPTGVTATAGDTTATVSWTAPSDGGSPITGYTVTSDPGAIVATTTGATSVVVPGLTDGVTYTFTVTATNAINTSGSSAPSNPVTPTAGTLQSNSAEGGTPGASVTTANSGGASGTAFTIVSKGSGATITYAAAAAVHGALGYALTGSSGTATLMGWNGYSATSMAIRFYYNPGSTLPNQVLRLADIRNSTATAARVELSASNQIFIQNNAGTTVTTFAHALQANTWYRIEMAISVSSSAASINAAYYTLDSTTPVDPAYTTATGNTGTASITQVTVGSTASATWTGTSYFDDIASQSPSTAFIGPVSASPTAPDAPTAVSAVPGDGQATVSWTAPLSNGGSAITGYTVTSSPGGFTATTAGPTSAIVSGLTDGTPYTFTVTATNGVGTGPASSPSSSVIPVAAPTAPGAPTGVNATPGDGQATVSWTAPLSNGGSAITGYTVTSSPGGFTGTSAGAATTAVVTGLADGTSYTFTVTAANSVGTGAASTPSPAVMPVAAPTAPGAPTAVSAVPGDGQATVSWTAPSSNGGAAITGYTVTSSPGGVTVSGPASPATVTGLTDGVSYTFTVTAANSVGTGPASAPSTGVIPAAAATAPGAPTAVSAVPGDRQATVSWTAPLSNGGSAITGYTVTSTPGSFTATTAGATSAAVTGLSDGISYTFTVTAANTVGTGPSSSPSPAVTPATTPGAPTGVTGTPGETQATVTWTAPVSNGGSAITGYTVTASPGVATATTAGATSAVVIGLTDGTPYTFTVTATNGNGAGPASDPSPSVVPGPTVPDAPTGVSAVPGDTQATVSWTAPASNGSPITNYTVLSSPGGFMATGATSPLTVTGLTDGTSYTFTVTATNGVGTGAASLPSSSVIPTAAATAPGAPTGVTATPGNTQATVTWTAPSNGGSAITGYTVTSSPGGFTANSAGPTSALVSGLTNGTTYTFTVTAANGVGTGPASGSSNTVTPSAGTFVSNSAEGGISGTSVTTGNSGGASGNALTVVTKGAGAALVYSTAAAAHGSLGYALTGASGTATLLGWNGYTAPSIAVRFYYNPGTTLPNAVLRLADIRNSTATAARVELSASNQLFIQNAAGATVTTFPHALQANTWYRVEITISVSASTATIQAAYYLSSSTAPVDPAYSTVTGNTGTTNITQVSIGSAASATWVGTSYFDDLAVQSLSTAFIGP
ncbi:MAG TPA: fibronectin type III domain-containing protein [Acidothermaceae bacterium]